MNGIRQHLRLSKASANAPYICPRRGVESKHTARNATAEAPVLEKSTQISITMDLNQHIREGHFETSLVNQQASKLDSEQPAISTILESADLTKVADVAVVGGGPAGLCLAANLAKRGVSVTLVAPADSNFVNNYGVWLDEFKALGLEHTLEMEWRNATCYFGEGNEKRIDRGYGRVSRRKLRAHLLEECRKVGVKFLGAEVSNMAVSADGMTSVVTTKCGKQFSSRLVTLAAGAAAGKFLQYETGAPIVASQTAYGIEAEVEGYGDVYPASEMLFMDFRRHHTGVWDGTAPILEPGCHPNAGDGVWGGEAEPPSFLYAMPLGGNRVFLQETCLVAKPALSFEVLKRRLDRRLKAVGVKVKRVIEEEHSYIPVGGPLPIRDQPLTAFGAAANLVHPATGFSISRSFREAPVMAEKIAEVLKQQRPVMEASGMVWDALWSLEKRTQSSFHVFGMELLISLDLAMTNSFFNTFFALPANYWRGFLASNLKSMDLVAFAGLMFVFAPVDIKVKLVSHLIQDPAGSYLISAYKAQYDAWQKEREQQQ